MLLRILFSDAAPMEKLQALVFSLIAVCIAMVFHEWAHAFAAYKCGDPSAKLVGRMSLNPMKHINPIGAVMLLLFGFGWASPVLINPANFKNKRVGMVVTSAAGPLMNFLICFVGMLISVVLSLVQIINGENFILQNLSMMFEYIYMLNMSFAVFNLIPLPPLDGSKIVAGFLPLKWQRKYLGLERYSIFIFLALILLLDTIDFLTPVQIALFGFFSDIIFRLIGLFL
ncbi:MAG: site-2 protease family protein [Clostridia bacterium]|nr:site-2 protease family protein [Clostridia bacterium]